MLRRRSGPGPIILTIVSLIIPPIIAFFTYLNEKNPKIYYSTLSLNIVPMEFIDGKIYEILLDKNIPSSIFTLTLINQGNSLANEVPISAEVPGDITIMTSTPSKEEQPIWIEIAKFQHESRKADVILRKMGITEPFEINIRYLRTSDSVEEEEVKIFFDGIPAKKVLDANTVPPWSYKTVIPRFLPWVGISVPVLIIAFLWFLVRALTSPTRVKIRRDRS